MFSRHFPKTPALVRPRRVGHACKLHGFLLIDKSAGWTSHDVVAKLRGLLRTRRIGHAGTLDPFATGLLVVGVGRATRLLQYAQGGRKRYLAHVTLGATTSTDDVDGEFISGSEEAALPSKQDVEHAISRFVGWIDQRPPEYSAVRVRGERSYARRRRGEHVELPSRRIHVGAIELVQFELPDLVLEIECGPGTYVRSIARDLGEALGTGAYCHGLRRVMSGELSVADAWTIEDLSKTDAVGDWPAIALHPDSVVQWMPAVKLDDVQSNAWYHGRLVDLPEPVAANEARVYGSTGELAGLGSIDESTLRPKLVFKLN